MTEEEKTPEKVDDVETDGHVDPVEVAEDLSQLSARELRNIKRRRDVK